MLREEIQPAFDYADGKISWLEFLRAIDGKEPEPDCLSNVQDREWVRQTAINLCKENGFEV